MLMRFATSFRTTSYEVMTTSYVFNLANSFVRSRVVPTYMSGRRFSVYFRISWYQWPASVGGQTTSEGRWTASGLLVSLYFSARS